MGESSQTASDSLLFVVVLRAAVFWACVVALGIRKHLARLSAVVRWETVCSLSDMQNLLRVDEQAVLTLLQQAGCEGEVVCQQPNKLLPEGDLKLLTQQEAWNHFESEQNTILLFPPTRLVTAICRNLLTDRKTVTDIQDSSSYMSIMEVVVKVLDFLGEQNKNFGQDLIVFSPCELSESE